MRTAKELIEAIEFWEALKGVLPVESKIKKLYEELEMVRNEIKRSRKNLRLGNSKGNQKIA